MATHDKYENDILKSLQKIARHLESIDKKMINQDAVSGKAPLGISADDIKSEKGEE